MVTAGIGSTFASCGLAINRLAHRAVCHWVECAKLGSVAMVDCIEPNGSWPGQRLDGWNYPYKLSIVGPTAQASKDRADDAGKQAFI